MYIISEYMLYRTDFKKILQKKGFIGHFVSQANMNSQYSYFIINEVFRYVNWL